MLCGLAFVKRLKPRVAGQYTCRSNQIRNPFLTVEQHQELMRFSDYDRKCFKRFADDMETFFSKREALS